MFNAGDMLFLRRFVRPGEVDGDRDCFRFLPVALRGDEKELEFERRRLRFWFMVRFLLLENGLDEPGVRLRLNSAGEIIMGYLNLFRPGERNGGMWIERYIKGCEIKNFL